MLNYLLYTCISISVIDGFGAESPSLDVTIILCGGCGSHGRCDYDDVIPTDNARYSSAVCSCEKGYSGMRTCFETDQKKHGIEYSIDLPLSVFCFVN